MFQIPEIDPSEVYEVRSREGKVYALPRMKNITYSQISLIGDLADVDGVRLLFEAIAPEFAAEVLPGLTTDMLGSLIEDWQHDSGLSMGESSASATS